MLNGMSKINQIKNLLCVYQALKHRNTKYSTLITQNTVTNKKTILLIKIRQNAKKKFFYGFELAKMYCEFTYTIDAFQDESWDLSNFICYEASRM